VVVYTLCSCTAYTIIGAAPDRYKDIDYRARVVRESRTVPREMGLDLRPTTEIPVSELKPLYLRLRELILTPGARSRSMRPWRRCSIPAEAAPKKDISGPSPVTTGPGVGPILRPLWPSSHRLHSVAYFLRNEPKRWRPERQVILFL
jgi:hypothetical protein